MSSAPPLKQYPDFRQADFDDYPIWVCVHGIDVNEPWYDAVDERTYRPYTGKIPYKCSAPSGPMAVAKSSFALADGTSLVGFSAPPFPPDGKKGYALSYRQPQIFLPDGRMAGFWFGGRKISVAERRRFYSALSRDPTNVFPIRYRIEKGLIDCINLGIIEGFTRLDEDFTTEVMER